MKEHEPFDDLDAMAEEAIKMGAMFPHDSPAWDYYMEHVVNPIYRARDTRDPEALTQTILAIKYLAGLASLPNEDLRKIADSE